MKKILYIVEAFGGGVFTYMVDLANAMCEEFDVTIAYALRDQTPEDYLGYFDKRIHMVRVKHFTRSIGLRGDIQAYFELRDLIRKVQPDILHFHSSKAGVLGRFAASSRIPMFYTPHGYSFLMSSHSQRHREIYKWIEKVCGLRNCTTVAVSKGEYEAALTVTKRATYVSNGVNLEDLQKVLLENVPVSRQYGEAAATRAGKQPIVCTLGRICEQKNPTAFNEIAMQFPNLTFYWIGDGYLREQLTAPNIVITGWVERTKALQIMQKADVFILPSLWEGLPMSLLEAMYLEKVCIVSNIIGNRDVIVDGKNGYLVEDTKGFCNRIQQILDEGVESLESIRQEAKSDVEREYNTTVMAQKYAALYHRAEKKVRSTSHSVPHQV